MSQREVSVRVFLFDDREEVVTAIKRALSAEPGLEVVGTQTQSQELVEQVLDAQPDILIVDYQLQNRSCISLVRSLRNYQNKPKILCFAGYASHAQIRAFFRAGGAGMLFKGNSIDSLIEAIHVVADGGQYIDKSIPEFVTGSVRSQSL